MSTSKTNENTKKLRAKHAKKWNKENSAILAFALNKSNPKHLEALKVLDTMEQKTKVDKFLHLIDLYVEKNAK